MARRFVTPLAESEQQTLASAYHHGEKRALRRRAHAILLSDQGHAIGQISEILQVRRDAISRWLKQWEATGLDGLIDKPRSGRTPILDEHDHQRLQAMVAASPDSILAGSLSRRDRQNGQHGDLSPGVEKKMTSASSAFVTH